MPQVDHIPIRETLSKLASSRAILGTLLALAILATWSNSYQSPLVLDDLGSIRDNASIRPPYHLNSLLNPPSEGAQTVAGRPLLNVSFAFNHLLSGDSYSAYRVTNVLIHIANALLVFVLAGRIHKLSLRKTEKPIQASPLVPFSLALIWALHPLSTTAVSYLVQRAESLAALFILLTLYFFIRSFDSQNPRRELALSLGAAFIGGACKETMVSAPFLVALLAWYLCTRSETALPGKTPSLKVYFAFLFLSILPTVMLSYGTGNRAGTANLGLSLESIDYLKLQSWAIVRYFQLSFWPSGLVFDYGRDIPIPPISVWLGFGLAILLVLAFCISLCVRRNPLGFLLLAAFILLAPSSSIFPLADPIFEHRFYLSLACVIGSVLYCIARFGPKYARLLMPAIALPLALATHARNDLYQDEIELWESSLRYSSHNARAQTNLGAILLAAGQAQAAITHLEKAVNIHPTPLRLHNLANAYALNSAAEKALPLYLQALASEPQFLAARLGLADANLSLGNLEQARDNYQKVLKQSPEHLLALRGYAQASLRQKRFPAAIKAYRKICEIESASATAWFDLADSLAQGQEFDEAKQALTKTIELDPQFAQAHANLGNLYLMEKSFPKAIAAYELALEIQPNAMVHTNLAISLIYSKRIQDAKTHLEKAIALDADYSPAINILKKLSAR